MPRSSLSSRLPTHSRFQQDPNLTGRPKNLLPALRGRRKPAGEMMGSAGRLAAEPGICCPPPEKNKNTTTTPPRLLLSPLCQETSLQTSTASETSQKIRPPAGVTLTDRRTAVSRFPVKRSGVNERGPKLLQTRTPCDMIALITHYGVSSALSASEYLCPDLYI